MVARSVASTLWLVTLLLLGCERNESTQVTLQDLLKVDVSSVQFPDEFTKAVEEYREILLVSVDPNGENAEGLDSDQRIPALREVAWRILGSRPLTNEQADRILHATKASFALAATDDVAAVDCFDPRHGLRIQTKDSTVDLLICFECSSSYLYKDGVELGRWFVSPRARSVFEQFVKDAELPSPSI